MILGSLCKPNFKLSSFETRFNTLRPRQNGRHFECIFLNENNKISIKITLKFVPKGPINKIPALVQIMAWRRPGDKPLSEPLMASSTTHIWVTQPQWVKRPLSLQEFSQRYIEWLWWQKHPSKCNLLCHGEQNDAALLIKVLNLVTELFCEVMSVRMITGSFFRAKLKISYTWTIFNKLTHWFLKDIIVIFKVW